MEKSDVFVVRVSRNQRALVQPTEHLVLHFPTTGAAPDLGPLGSWASVVRVARTEDEAVLWATDASSIAGVVIDAKASPRTRALVATFGAPLLEIPPEASPERRAELLLAFVPRAHSTAALRALRVELLTRELRFTPREARCAWWIFRGRTTAPELGAVLGLSHTTIPPILSALRAKTGLRSVHDMRALFVRAADGDPSARPALAR